MEFAAWRLAVQNGGGLNDGGLNLIQKLCNLQFFLKTHGLLRLGGGTLQSHVGYNYFTHGVNSFFWIGRRILNTKKPRGLVQDLRDESFTQFAVPP